MRMWMVNPALMCRRHLLGEHAEIHMLVSCILQGKSIKGYIDRNLVSPWDISPRHSLLRDEMVKRGYHHNSDIPSESIFKITGMGLVPFTFMIDETKSASDLRKRCNLCQC